MQTRPVQVKDCFFFPKNQECCWCTSSSYYMWVHGCGSRGKVDHLLIGGLAIPPVHMSNCLWARHWTLCCYRASGGGSAEASALLIQDGISGEGCVRKGCEKKHKPNQKSRFPCQVWAGPICELADDLLWWPPIGNYYMQMKNGKVEKRVKRVWRAFYACLETEKRPHGGALWKVGSITRKSFQPT